MQPGQIELLIRHDLCGILRRFCRFRHLLNLTLLRSVADQQIILCIIDFYHQIRLFLIRNRKGLFKDMIWRNHGFLLYTLGTFIFKNNLRIAVFRGCIDADIDPLHPGLHIYHGMDRSIFHRANSFVRHKILLKGLFLKWLQPCKIRLVIRIYPRHQFNIGSVLVRKITIPGSAEVSASPGPLFFTGGNMMIGHVKDSCLFPVVIAPQEVIVGMLRHKRSRYRNILVPGNVHTRAVIFLIIHSGGNRETGHIPLAVIHYCVDIRRENGLGILIHRHRRIRPPQKGLRKRCSIIQLTFYLNIGLIRI